MEIISKDNHEKTNMIVIYGAGSYANCLYAYLYLTNQADQVKAFVVTELDGSKSEVYGKPIIQISDNMSSRIIGGNRVFIAVSESKSYGIRDLVLRYEPNEIIQITSDDYASMLESIYKIAAELPIKKNVIFVDSYYGLGYRCNCKYIADYLIKEKCPVKIIWNTLATMDTQLPSGISKVVKGTIEYYLSMYTARIYLTNCGSEPFYIKRPEQYMINTWHGTGPFKKAGMSVNGMSDAEKHISRHIFDQVDLFISNSKDNSEMYRESFGFEKEIMECGYPRNDIFYNEQNRNRVTKKVRSVLRIPESQKLVLYVPTFREQRENSDKFYNLDMKRVLRSLESRFNESYKLMYRFHHALYKYDNYHNFFDDAIDVTLYEDIQELLLIADILITDYSSVMWDFSLMRKPVFLYHNDESNYLNERGFYWPPSEWPYPKAHNSDEMCSIIENFCDADYQSKLDVFFERDPSYDDGFASKRVANRIMDVINNPGKYVIN